jgi:molecular chaperone DnaJ
MASARRNYYDVLGVDRAAGLGAIRKAFRVRARRLHPDASADPDAGERFRELVDAYSVLSGGPSRLLYDRLGHRGRGDSGFSDSAGGAETRDDFDAAEAVELAPEVQIGFFEALWGTTTVAHVEGPVACRACGGRGETSDDPEPCSSCAGTGRFRHTTRDGAARVREVGPCPRCGGRGTLAPPCADCGGSGRVDLNGVVLVTVPPGAQDGDRIALADGGEIVVRVPPPSRGDRGVRIAATSGLAVACALLALVLFG